MTAARLDVHLVSVGLARSRGQARELIDSGAVTVDGRVATRASERVGPDNVVEATADPWVGRAAYKLLAALDLFSTGDAPARPAAGARCLDIGASTGGFTQVLLARGAAAVVALDVGHGQLATVVADDQRVEERSGVNVRDVRAGDLGEPFDIVVGDLSFISLRYVWPVLAQQLAADGDAIMLVKPQFEVGRERLGKGGVVRSERERLRAVREALLAACASGLMPVRLATSPLQGGSGNVEYLVLLRHATAPADHQNERTGARGRALDSTGGEATVERLIERLDEGLT
ncbi:MAG: TlyA family RNA methyltransferase [Dermatophilus congolensis]|nr:TlyA family RNA methyltransferase [Dermatophilus congolensis]